MKPKRHTDLKRLYPFLLVALLGHCAFYFLPLRSTKPGTRSSPIVVETLVSDTKTRSKRGASASKPPMAEARPRSEASPGAPALPAISLVTPGDPSWFSKLAAAIESNKTYPEESQERRESGSVVVAFTVKSSGELAQVRVAKSSGNESLDRAARDAVKNVRQVDPISADLDLQQRIDFTLVE